MWEIDSLHQRLNGIIVKQKNNNENVLCSFIEWEFPNEILQKAQVEQNEKFTGEGYFLIFVSQLNDDFNHMVEVIAELINHNLEREEKERLLKMKVIELKEIFKSSSLDELKGLKINLEHDFDQPHDQARTCQGQPHGRHAALQ